ncbi:hypothetical protein J007_05721 [Cryptococcus neoformans]|nr:hypothetical protein J007_05721 [Cryptococcus neoformans var. grubii]OXC58795.1 hypothetical protein C358_05839 [Cryptococcus neoformans var. grubii MW-RSA852]
MEAICQVGDRYQNNDSLSNSKNSPVNDLPPPPEPFPLDLLSENVSSSIGSRAESDQILIVKHLRSVQRSCIDALSALLPDHPAQNGDVDWDPTLIADSDDQLAWAVMELLEVTYELEGLTPSPAESMLQKERGEEVVIGDFGSLENLTSQLDKLQSARMASRPQTPTIGTYTDASALHPAISMVRLELARARLESLILAVVELSRQRHQQSTKNRETSPPSYETYHNGSHELPQYSEANPNASSASVSKLADSPTAKGDFRSRSSLESSRSRRSADREKMLNELEAVTSAVERLYSVCPQLSNQRVEVRPLARSSTKDRHHRNDETADLNADERVDEGQKMKELDEIWLQLQGAKRKRMERQRADVNTSQSRSKEKFIARLVEQAEKRRLPSQDGEMGAVDGELAKARELRDKDHFLQDLIEQSADRRFDNQDAAAPPEDRSATRHAKQQALINALVTHIQTTRLASQDFPLTFEDKLAENRSAFVNQLVEYSSAGRLYDQDSLPPTPRGDENMGIGEEKDPMEIVTVKDFLASNRPPIPQSEADTGGSAEKREMSSSEGGGKRRVVSKIAGMVRKGGAHLGQKFTFSPDQNNVTYVVEHQENLKSLQILVHGIGISSNLELNIKTLPSSSGSTNAAIITSKREPSLSIDVALPALVYSDQIMPLVPQSLYQEAKLSALPTPAASNALIITHALSAPDLRSLKVTALCCTICERHLSSLPFSRDPRQAYKDLPSDHWAEMIDIWMCHDDPAFTARLAGMTEEGFWPTDGGVLVGGSYLLVEETRGKWETLRKGTQKENETWRLINCKCGEVVGKQRVDDGKPGSRTLRFSKWAIGLLDDEDDDGEITRFPFSVFIVSDMLELAQAHASFRFIISEEETGDQKLYLWLFNASTSVSYFKPTLTSAQTSPLRSSFTVYQASERRSVRSRRSSAASSIKTNNSGGNGASVKGDDRGKVIKAVKIMYKVVDESANLDRLPGFGPGGQIEHLTYSREVCSRLIAMLKESTSVYPAARRSMGAFDVGFLERA